MKRKYFIASVLCLAFSTFVAYGARKPRNVFPVVNSGEMGSRMDGNMDTKKTNKGSPAPDFEMMDLNGNAVKLSSFASEKVYIKHWASWCPVCLDGLEDISTLSAKDNGSRVLTTIAPGNKGEKNGEDFKAWFAGVEYTENIAVLLDIDGACTNRTGIRGSPTSEYIGSDGTLISLTPSHAGNETIKNTPEAVN